MAVPQKKHNSRQGHLSVMVVVGLCVVGLLVYLASTLRTALPSGVLTTDAKTSSQASVPSPIPTNMGVVKFTPTKSDCTQTQGKIIEDNLFSDEFDESIPIMLYLPPCLNHQAEDNEIYPTLYLLHGVGGDESQWISLGLSQEMDAAIVAGSPAFIVVMPLIPEPLSWPSDRNAIFITEELIPYIDTHFPTYADHQFRAIGGLSRGAAWALRIGLSRSASFSKIGLHSLPLYDDEVNYWTNILEEMSSAERPALFMDSGNNDDNLGSALLFDQKLTQINITHTWQLFNGYHNEEYWSEHLPIYLEWYAHGW